MTAAEPRTVTLAEFLLARIAEDEDVAKRAGWGYGGAWVSVTDEVEDWSTVHAETQRDMVGCEDGDVTRHIARHDPARVLAECAAKRQIVTAYNDGFATRKLASVYADHPDYDPAWA